jgi:hypothetical protein
MQRLPVRSAWLTGRALEPRWITDGVPAWSLISRFSVMRRDSPPRARFSRIPGGRSDAGTSTTLFFIVSSATSVQKISPPSTMLWAKVTLRVASVLLTPEMVTATVPVWCTMMLDSIMMSVGEPAPVGSKSML